MADVDLTKKEQPASQRFASVNDIKLGMIVRDPASGLTGVAGFRSQSLSGTVQYAIQPQGDGTTVPDGHFVDDFMLEYIGVGVSDRTPAEDANAKFVLGTELEDTVSGFKGVAVERITYLNGCVHYTLQPPNKSKGMIGKILSEPAKAVHFDYKRLKKVGDGINAAAKKAEPAEEPFKRSTTGGPSRSIRSVIG